MSLEHNLTHGADALARLLEQLKDVAGLASMLNALNVQTQAIEDALWQLLNERWLGTAEGEQLNVIGRILDEPNEGLSDDLYEQRLRAKIRVLRSSGTAPNILKIFKLLLPNNTLVFASMGGGSFILDLGEVDADMVSTYVRFIREAKSAGINGQLLYFGGDEGGDLDHAFTLSEDDSTTAGDTDKGFAPYPADGTGGKFSDVIV